MVRERYPRVIYPAAQLQVSAPRLPSAGRLATYEWVTTGTLQPCASISACAGQVPHVTPVKECYSLL